MTNTGRHHELSSLPIDIKRYSSDVAEYIDKHVEQLAGTIRDSLASSPWIPDSIRPHIPAPAPNAVVISASTYERVQGWLERHKILVGFVVLATGTIAYRSYRRSKSCRKTRKARKARNGGRLEVIVVAGSPALPLTRSLSLDMERKGFIVYIVCSTIEDEVMVQNLSRPDIRPLTIDITDVSAAGAEEEVPRR